MLHIELFYSPEELLWPSKGSVICPVTGTPLLGLPELLIFNSGVYIIFSYARYSYNSIKVHNQWDKYSP